MKSMLKASWDNGGSNLAGAYRFYGADAGCRGQDKKLGKDKRRYFA